MKIALAEVFSTVLLTFSYSINFLYGVLTYNMITKSEDRMQIERCITFVTATVLFYLNYYASCYLYIVVSKSFRHETKRVITKYLKLPIPGRL